MKLLVLLTLVGFCTCQAAVSAQNSKITLSATNTTDGLHVHLQIR